MELVGPVSKPALRMRRLTITVLITMPLSNSLLMASECISLTTLIISSIRRHLEQLPGILRLQIFHPFRLVFLAQVPETIRQEQRRPLSLEHLPEFSKPLPGELR